MSDASTLHPIEASELHARRERVFLLVAGIFLGTLAMLNILGITRFIDLSFEVFGVTIPMALAVGVLPYPVTFLCTDIISEFYGQRRANWVVFVGLILNIWVVFILWLGGVLPPEVAIDPATSLPPEGMAFLSPFSPSASPRRCAYLAAQFCDVYPSLLEAPNPG